MTHVLGHSRVEFRVEFRRRELRSDCSDSCRLRCAKARTQNIAPLSLEGVSQMDSILPVRPGNDLVELGRFCALRPQREQVTKW